MESNGVCTFTDPNGDSFTLTPELNNSTGSGLGDFNLQSSNGEIDLNLNANDISSVSLGATVSLTTDLGDTLQLNAQTGTGTLDFTGGGAQSIGAPADIELDPDVIRVDPSLNANGFGTDYDLDSAGGLDGNAQGYFGLPDDLTYAQASSDTSALSTALSSAYTSDARQGSTSESLLTSIVVDPLGTAFGNGGGTNADATDAGGVAGGLVIVGPGLAVTDPYANTYGLFYNDPADVVTGDWQPGQARIIDSSQNATDLIDGWDDSLGGILDDAASADAPLSDYESGAQSFADTDPLLVDLTGSGIQVSNWIGNDVYFKTNITNEGTGQAAVDPSLHHTSWMQGGTGMLVFDPGDTAITSITQTVSEYMNVSGNAAGVGDYADGLAALASLSNSTSVFSAATSKTDAVTGQLYWNEIMVATGNPDATGTITTNQLETLAQASIASISLAGTGNLGESIDGSGVTNTLSYTTTAGATMAAAAVDFQTDTTGDVIVQSNGSVTITSTPEGGASAATSYVDQSSAGGTWTLNHGTLSENGTQVATGITGFFATAQNGESLTVNSADTNSYWLGGGTGQATLTGGTGNTMFLINHLTTVHGGTGFNIAQVDDTAPITVDLAASNLQEVIGGAGDGTFNASGTQDNVFIQGGSGNNVIIGGYGLDALAGGTGDDLIKAGSGGSVIHAGAGNDVIYGGSGTTVSESTTTANSDVIYGGAGNDTVVLGKNSSAVYAGTGSMTVIGNDTQTVTGSTKAFSEILFSGDYTDYALTTNADGSTTVTDNNGANGPVTFENITDIGFADIGQISLSASPPMPVNDVVSVSGSGPYRIYASSLLSNDLDYQGKTVSIQALEDINGNQIVKGASGTVTGGTVALSADGSTITFTPTAGFVGIPSFRYYIVDPYGIQTGYLTRCFKKEYIGAICEYAPKYAPSP